MPWVRGLPREVVFLDGIVEILGGVGVILPRLTNILPRLTPVAAAGLATVMAIAIVLHATRTEVLRHRNDRVSLPARGVCGRRTVVPCTVTATYVQASSQSRLLPWSATNPSRPVPRPWNLGHSQRIVHPDLDGWNAVIRRRSF